MTIDEVLRDPALRRLMLAFADNLLDERKSGGRGGRRVRRADSGVASEVEDDNDENSDYHEEEDNDDDEDEQEDETESSVSFLDEEGPDESEEEVLIAEEEHWMDGNSDYSSGFSSYSEQPGRKKCEHMYVWISDRTVRCSSCGIFAKKKGRALQDARRRAIEPNRPPPPRYEPKQQYPRSRKSDRDEETCKTLVMEILQFADGQEPFLALPPVSRRIRRVIHLVSGECNLKSQSTGQGKRRHTTVYRRHRSAAISASHAYKIISRALAKPAGNPEDCKVNGHDPAKRRTARPLDQSNAGYQMLRAMGWEEGDGLGNSSRGISEPVKSVALVGRRGLS